MSATIKDLYAGKPDAKDELSFEGIDKFIKSYVVAEHFNIDLLVNGNNCFITGFKGTGKTALLFYLEEIVKKVDSSACASYIFFKEDYTDMRRNELSALSQRILSSISVEPGVLINSKEFEYIWRWIIYKQIVNDNEEYNRNLFVDDENWEQFENIVNRIKEPKNKRKYTIPSKIKIALPFMDNGTMTEVAPEVEVNFEKNSSAEYAQFVELVDSAEDAFSKVIKTDIPYYIFIDELEAYYGDVDIFHRDLCMIRDLVFTVKRFNTIFAQSNMRKTKIVCSVRSEIINAINRFVVSKEINKVLSGFSIPLEWNYSNDTSYLHPIIQILLKRIALCDGNEETGVELYRKWFPEKIHNQEPAKYILNNSWFKPRDMIRLLICAQNCMHNGKSEFTQDVLDSFAKEYSQESLNEIREELRALYSSSEIDTIVNFFTGFQTSFSMQELNERIRRFFPNTILETKLQQVLSDLYRLGFIGNILPRTKTYHWQHRGDASLIISDEWRICIHSALFKALSIGSSNNFGQKIGALPQKGDVAIASIIKISREYVIVKFMKKDCINTGFIHKSCFEKYFDMSYISDLSDYISREDKFRVVILDYNEKHKNWILDIADIKITDEM